MDVRGAIRYAAAPGFTGVDEISYTATDPVTGAYATARLTVMVTPVALDDTAATPVGVPVTVDVLADDACTSCALAVGEVLGEAQVTVVDGGLRVVPAPGWSGEVRAGYTATDPATDEQASAVLVVAVDDARPYEPPPPPTASR